MENLEINKHMEITRKLKMEQALIVEDIYSFAKEHGLSNGDAYEAIPDGIYSVERYLAAPYRILWILKEPCDEISETGMPCGGGWCIYEAFDNANAWRTPTWQPIIYATYGLFHSKQYQQMDWIRDDHSMTDVLKDIAYINISKMPALTVSKATDIQRYYELWRPILLKQIRLYQPQIIIFGNTFKFFKQDLVGSEALPIQSLVAKAKNQHIYRMKDTLLIDAYHPNQRTIPREEYINGIIECATYFLNKDLKR